jgi:hypothetical protein
VEPPSFSLSLLGKEGTVVAEAALLGPAPERPRSCAIERR